MFLMFPISISFLGNAFCQFLTDEWRDIACFNNRAFDSNHWLDMSRIYRKKKLNKANRHTKRHGWLKQAARWVVTKIWVCAIGSSRWICRRTLMKKTILKKHTCRRVLYGYLSLCWVQVFILKYEIQTESRKFNPWLKMDLRNVSSASECQSSVILDWMHSWVAAGRMAPFFACEECEKRFGDRRAEFEEPCKLAVAQHFEVSQSKGKFWVDKEFQGVPEMIGKGER